MEEKCTLPAAPHLPLPAAAPTSIPGGQKSGIIPGDPSRGWRRTLPSSSTSPPIVNTNFAQYYQEIHTAPLTLSEPALFCGFLLECEFADIFTLLQRFYLLYKGKIYYVRSERIILWS
jgi:hypothetical protein